MRHGGRFDGNERMYGSERGETTRTAAGLLVLYYPSHDNRHTNVTPCNIVSSLGVKHDPILDWRVTRVVVFPNNTESL